MRIMYVIYVFNDDGEMHDLIYFTNEVDEKNNIICEYFMLKHATRLHTNSFNCTYAK